MYSSTASSRISPSSERQTVAIADLLESDVAVRLSLEAEADVSRRAERRVRGQRLANARLRVCHARVREQLLIHGVVVEAGPDLAPTAASHELLLDFHRTLSPAEEPSRALLASSRAVNPGERRVELAALFAPFQVPHDETLARCRRIAPIRETPMPISATVLGSVAIGGARFLTRTTMSW